MAIFSQTSQTVSPVSGRHPDFAYIADADVYLDSACATMRPEPVVDALMEYYHSYNACGERVRYAWGRRVNEEVAAARLAALRLFGLPAKHYEACFTLNTTYGLNLLLQQLPAGYKRVVTSETEHNSVFVSTMTYAQKHDIERLVLERADDGALLYEPAQLQRAVVVVSAMSNVDGRQLPNVRQLVRDAHAAGGIVIIDAAQAAGHCPELLRKTEADAICFSAHKLYGASLGVAIVRRDLLRKLEVIFAGGGMVTSVREQEFTLLPDDKLHTRLEPGLQAWGEIIALRAALEWREYARFDGLRAQEYEARLAQQLQDGLRDIPGLHVLAVAGSPVISVYSDKHDAHRLALFLSEAGVMVRSGHFCAHYWLEERLKLPPLLRFSVGLHNTPQDINHALEVLGRFMKELG